MTIAEALVQATARLAEAGVPGAARDARVLLGHVLGCGASELTLRGQDPLIDAAISAFDTAIAARMARQPVAQITGGRDFYGRRFEVTPDVLDPRPDTETLIACALDLPWNTVLDLGTGSGCILLTLLAERAGASGLGVDVSPAAIAVARRNATALAVDADFAESHWFDGVTGRFDLIVSNPPYIAANELPDLAPEVRDHEPLIALSPGGDGLDAYRQIGERALAHLAPGGHLVVEIGASQSAGVTAILQKAGFAAPRVHRDINGRDRVIVARAGA